MTNANIINQAITDTMTPRRTGSIPFNLQLFAESGAEGGEGGEGAKGSEGGEGGAEGDKGGDKGDKGGNKFDDILKEKEHQAEFDRRINKALETAKGKWETDTQGKIEAAKTEAEKLARMNAEEKAKYAEEKRVVDLEKREKDITTRELKAQAYEQLAEKGMPKDLVEILDYSNAENCKKSIESVGAAFQIAVEKAVNEKLRGSGTLQTGKGGGSTADAGLRAAFGLPNA